MRYGSTRMLLLVAAVGLVAAACAGTDDDATTPESSTTTSGSSTTTPADTSSTTSSTAGSAAAGGTVTGDLGFTVAEGYTATFVGEGIKPDLALAPDGTPGITYLVEDLSGFIAYADAGSGWTPEQVVEGYFYGPIGLAYTPDAVPHIAYHDHQDTTFKQDLGDLTLATAGESGWTIEAINDDGHDGWDSTIAIGPDGVVRAAGIDPEQFGSTDGVEYYEIVDGNWDITAIGSGAVAYEFNVSLAVDPDGNPAITYYDTTNADLQYASRRDGVWTISTVDADGDVGRYSSLAFDADGTPHISYLRLDGTAEGTVRYATRDGETWTTADVGTVTDLRAGFTGARRVTAITVDPDQTPHIVFSDQSIVNQAVAAGSGWETSTIVTAGDRPLGQLVSFQIGVDGIAHLALFEVTSLDPLSGVIAYITAG